MRHPYPQLGICCRHVSEHTESAAL